jgi:hypothetical protein
MLVTSWDSWYSHYSWVLDRVARSSECNVMAVGVDRSPVLPHAILAAGARDANWVYGKLIESPINKVHVSWSVLKIQTFLMFRLWESLRFLFGARGVHSGWQEYERLGCARIQGRRINFSRIWMEAINDTAVFTAQYPSELTQITFQQFIPLFPRNIAVLEFMSLFQWGADPRRSHQCWALMGPLVLREQEGSSNNSVPRQLMSTIELDSFHSESSRFVWSQIDANKWWSDRDGEEVPLYLS